MMTTIAYASLVSLLDYVDINYKTPNFDIKYFINKINAHNNLYKKLSVEQQGKLSLLFSQHLKEHS